ncbi:hypothetical protein [Aquipuribacter sp. MA13-6]|uniref:hypothetical protein n=1 Tax=unclassified Aquipuribacter TaxID=2635084 RepID=UPI003EECCF9D
MKATHTDDGGDLSIFTSGDEVLIACNEGHYWLLKAEQRDVPDTTAAVKLLRMNSDLSQSLMTFVKKPGG